MKIYMVEEGKGWPKDHPLLPYAIEAEKMVSEEGYTWPQALAYLRTILLGKGVSSSIVDTWLERCAEQVGVSDQIRF